jgi:uncharacterized protein (TIGR03643 family)
MENRVADWSESEQDRLIEMAWEDRTPFEAIFIQFGVHEAQVIDLMRLWMRPSSYRMWRKRMEGRKTKHGDRNQGEGGRFRCSRQRQITGNKISKRL